MFDQDSPFFRRSKIVAEEFLQTTVIVDDQAYFGDEKSILEIEPPTPIDLKPPGRGAGAFSGKEASAESEDSLVSPPYAIGSHRLNAQKVINSFAQKRIVCSVIRPTDNDDDDWTISVENLATSADIIIVDWELNKDNGENTLNILEQIIKSAIDSPAQLRLFAIYTGEPGIAQIAKDVKTALEERLNVKINVQDDGFSLTFASTRIVIFAKPGTSNLPQYYEHRRVPFEGLADRVTSEFAIMTAGLVSNAVLKSFTQVRLNTYKILNVFSKILNAPYLTHRALLPLTEDAEALLHSLIAKEIEGVLEETHVGVEGNLEAISDWLNSQQKEISIEFDLDDENTLILNTPEQLLLLLEKGIREAIIEDSVGLTKDLSKTKRRELVKHLEEKFHVIPFTQGFGSNEAVEELSDEKFAHITVMRSFYMGKAPKLTLGTILKNESESSYWVCLQPRCDCVRIRTSRAFPFIPLQVQSNRQKFDIVVFEGEHYLRLALSYKPHKLNLITFVSKPEDNGCIVSEKVDTAYYFFDTNKEKYKWLGELKSEHAQRIANQFAANLSRVGLDESEWLRLWATRGN